MANLKNGLVLACLWRLHPAFAEDCGSASDEACEASGAASVIQKHRMKDRAEGFHERIDHETSLARERARVKLVIEQDFSKLDKSFYREWHADEDCQTNALHAFDGLKTKMADWQLTKEEEERFRERFIEDMVYRCKQAGHGKIQQTWVDEVATAMEDEKPAVPCALEDSINGAGVGYTISCAGREHESMHTLHERCGKVVSDEERSARMLQAERRSKVNKSLSGTKVPTSFHSAEQWPMCADVVQRIHNQGVCGSCWAFGGLSALDSRLCIITDGEFQGQLSRGYATSCKAGGNGCGGGLATHAFRVADGLGGIPTGGSSGCSPYFGHGAGTDHFNQGMPAPSCPSTCHNEHGYDRSLQNDLFILPGLYTGAIEEWNTNGGFNEDAKRNMLDYGPLSFGIYANSPFMGYAGGIFNNGCGESPNHEVVAIGWGDGYFVGLNSWGPNWGEGGGFRVADCIPTDFTLPGQIAAHATIPLRSGGTTELSGPADTVEDDASSVGGAPDSTGHFRVESGRCVAHADGCVSSPGYPGLYGNSESCKITPSSPFDSIDVLDFGTEYWFDTLIVDGVKFSGVLDGSAPEGVPVRNEITWTADESLATNGWFICPPTQTA